jgi:hypothetical protein
VLTAMSWTLCTGWGRNSNFHASMALLTVKPRGTVSHQSRRGKARQTRTPKGRNRATSETASTDAKFTQPGAPRCCHSANTPRSQPRAGCPPGSLMEIGGLPVRTLLIQGVVVLAPEAGEQLEDIRPASELVNEHAEQGGFFRFVTVIFLVWWQGKSSPPCRLW